MKKYLLLAIVLFIATPTFAICSPYIPFLGQCKNYLESVIKLDNNIISIGKSGGCYAVSVQSIWPCKQIYDLLYTKSGCDFYLVRKYKSAQHALRYI